MQFPLNGFLQLSIGWPGWIDDQRASDNLDQRVAENPFYGYSGARWIFALSEVRAVGFVQCIVLYFVGEEARIAGWPGNGVGMGLADEDVEMDEAIHITAGSLDRSLQSVHGASNVLFEGIGGQDVITWMVSSVLIGFAPS